MFLFVSLRHVFQDMSCKFNLCTIWGDLFFRTNDFVKLHHSINFSLKLVYLKTMCIKILVNIETKLAMIFVRFQYSTMVCLLYNIWPLF